MTPPAYEGRLELTWTNKHMRLLAHPDGSYEWVPPGDYRVAEVRLLHDVVTVGQVGRTRSVGNLLIRGDALNALTIAKREAAQRWANYVTADEQVGVTWRYLLAPESDVKAAKRSWAALKKLGA
jgi:hypothetical protein